MVTGMHFRHPAVTAAMASTLDIVSSGRFELGLGAGWYELEANAYGIDLGSVDERMTRFEEGTEVNGFGANVARWLADHAGDQASPRLAVMGVADRLVEHASRAEQLEEVGLTPAGIAARARSLSASDGLAAVRETA